MLKAAIFDMDGLLIDSEPHWRQANLTMLADHGITAADNDLKVYTGIRTLDVVQMQRKTYGLSEADHHQMAQKIFDNVIKHIKERGTALEGAHDLLKTIKGRGIPIALASSSPPEVIEAVINKLDIADYIDLTCSAVYEEHGKPHPAVYLTTAKRLGVAPEDCVAFEDSVAGVTAALAAGMKCVAVPENQNFDHPAIRKADLVLKTLAEVRWEMITTLWHKGD